MSTKRAFQITPGRDADRSFGAVDRMPAFTRQAIRRAMFEIGGDAQRDLKSGLSSGPRSGRRYLVKGSLHQSSARGEFPARLSGRLARSPDYSVRGAREVEVGVNTGKRYPKFLEESRPFIEPTAKRHAQKFAEFLGNFTKITIKRESSR